MCPFSSGETRLFLADIRRSRSICFSLCSVENRPTCGAKQRRSSFQLVLTGQWVEVKVNYSTTTDWPVAVNLNDNAEFDMGNDHPAMVHSKVLLLFSVSVSAGKLCVRTCSRRQVALQREKKGGTKFASEHDVDRTETMDLLKGWLRKEIQQANPHIHQHHINNSCSNNMMLVNVWICLMIMISQQEPSLRKEIVCLRNKPGVPGWFLLLKLAELHLQLCQERVTWDWHCEARGCSTQECTPSLNAPYWWDESKSTPKWRAQSPRMISFAQRLKAVASTGWNAEQAGVQARKELTILSTEYSTSTQAHT